MTADNVVAMDGRDPSAVYRVAPMNVEAEKGLLGAIFVDNRAYERVGEFLKPEHFYMPVHGQIYEAVQRLLERGHVADPVTLKPLTDRSAGLSDLGGAEYLIELAESAATVINAGEYGRIVYDLYLKRQLIALGEDVVNRVYGQTAEENAGQQIEVAEQHLYDLATAGEYGGGFKPFAASMVKALEIAETAHRRDGGLAGVTTGLIEIDKLLGGLHPSDLIILAARPSMGKTALATDIAYNAAERYALTGGDEGAVVGFYSLEMSSEQLATRILCQQAGLSADAMRKGELSNEDFSQLVGVSQELQRLPFFIDDTPALTVSALRTRARRLKRQHKLGLIVVDYLQLVEAAQRDRRDGRVQEVSEITRGLKTLAKELDVPVLALSQLSRKVEEREDRRPQLSDLRESGSIEQDSDVVMFIFREEYYLERHEPVQGANENDQSFFNKHDRWERRRRETANLAEINVAKQRHGPIGMRRLFFDAAHTHFADWDRAPPEDPL